MKFPLPREKRLRKTCQFSKVRKEGVSIRENPFWLQARIADDGHSRVGVIVTRKLGNAVMRNSAKRMVKELFRLHHRSFPMNCHFVVLPRKSIFQTPFVSLEKTFLFAASKAFNKL